MPRSLTTATYSVAVVFAWSGVASHADTISIPADHSTIHAALDAVPPQPTHLDSDGNTSKTGASGFMDGNGDSEPIVDRRAHEFCMDCNDNGLADPCDIS